MGYYAGQSNGRDRRPHGDYDFSNSRPKQPPVRPATPVDSLVAEIVKTGRYIEKLRRRAHDLAEADDA